MLGRTEASVVLLAVLLLGTSAYSAFEYPSGSVVSFGMGGAVDLSHPSVLDFFYQPALISPARVAAEFSYARLYDLPDFEHISGSMILRRRQFCAGVATSQLTGGEYYWERSHLLTASSRIWRGLRVGCSINYLRIQFSEGYADLNLTSVSVGMMCAPGGKLSLASSIRNINQPSYGPGAGKMPLTGELSASFTLSDQVRFHLTHHYEDDMRDRFSLGMKTKAHRMMEIFFGLGTDPTELGAGLSLVLGHFSFDYGFRDNVYLGGTHRFGLRIEY